MLIQTAVFGDGPLGREICGDEAGIRALPASAIRDFWGTAYRPANTVVAVSGDLTQALVLLAGTAGIIGFISALLAPPREHKRMVSSSATFAEAQGGTKATPMQA
jgi:hypothetical protein